MEYTEFLQTKVKTVQDSGFDIQESELSNHLFEFQKYIVRKALKLGKYAIFAMTGLGKTRMQLEFGNQIYINKKANKVLFLCPLGVLGQTIKEGENIGISIEKLNSTNYINQNGLFISNYEQIENIDTTEFDAVILDESSILKSFTGVTRNLLIDRFKHCTYKLCCTATPSPNDYTEIGNHSQFLDILDSSDMLTRFFSNNTTQAGTFDLKKHAKKDFFKWLNYWSTAVTKPSDINKSFSDVGYILPRLNIIEKKVYTKKTDNGKLFNDTSVNATNFNQALRNTKEDRLNIIIDIVNNSKENFIVWVKQNEDADYLKKHITDAVEVRGSEKSEVKETKLLDFAQNKYRVLITKIKIAGFGLNYQNCNNQIFASPDFSFEGEFQAIRRSYRFGQTKEVNIYMICPDNMENVEHILKTKEDKFNTMINQMIENNKEDLKVDLQINYKHQVYKNEMFEFHNGDCVELIDLIDDNSIDFSIFSPPFSSLYTYSDNIRDMGNCDSDEEFFRNYRYLLTKLFKKIRPGRLVAVHTKDLPMYKSKHGASGFRDFTGENLKLMEEVGFVYHSKITIWTDPVFERARTNTQRLLYKQVKNDSSLSGVGTPEYLTIFRKWENIDSDLYKPVDWKLDGFDLDTWQKWASPVWFDIHRIDVLNPNPARCPEDEKHLAPLQLGVIERAVAMWTNPNEIVYTPFGGIASELYQSVLMGRKAIGHELKESYWKQGCKNLDLAIKESNQLSLFTA